MAKEKQISKQPVKNTKKAVNYVLIIVLAGSILYSVIMMARYISNEFDFSTKNEVALYILWCLVIAYLLQSNL